MEMLDAPLAHPTVLGNPTDPVVSKVRSGWGRSKAAVDNGPPAAGTPVVTAQVGGYSMQGRVTRAISPL